MSHTTTSAYDSRGRLTTVTDPLSNERRYGYNANGDLVTITEYDPAPLSYITTYAYDNLHRLKTYTDPRNKTITAGALDVHLRRLAQPDQRA